jgi:hypothetical protein
LSSIAAALWNCSGKNTDQSKVWTSGGFKYAERHRQRATRGVSPPLGEARRGGVPPHGEAALWPPLRLSFGPCPSSGKNRSFGLRFVQF